MQQRDTHHHHKPNPTYHSGPAQFFTVILRVIVILGLILNFLLIQPEHTRASEVRGFSVYYVPGNEADIITAIDEIDPQSSSGPVISTVSVVSSGDDVQVYLDEYENGYNMDLADPYNTADAKWDIATTGPNEQGPELDKGDTLNLTHTDTFVSGSGGVNGGDRIYVTGAPVSVIRTVWLSDPGPVLGGAWELYPINAWQDSYTIPIGEDTNAGGNPLNLRFGQSPFYLTYLFVQAESDGTTVTVNNPGDPGSPYTLNLDQGDNGYIEDINSGATISSNYPVQAMIITGGAARTQAPGACPGASTWDGRFFTLTPEAFLGQEYYIPMPSMKFPDDHSNGKTCDYGSGQEGAYVDTGAYIYAFENNTSITIEYIDQGSGLLTTDTQTLTNAGDVYRFVMPRMPAHLDRNPPNNVACPTCLFGGEYGARVTADKKIWVLVAGDDGAAGLDWGFQTINSELLSDHYYIPYAIYNPIHVTPVNDFTEFFVDFNNDEVVDLNFTIDRFDTRMIYPDPALTSPAYNATGTHIYASGPFAISWGQDHSEFSPGETLPDQDWGYTVLPLAYVESTLSIEKTANPTVLPASGGTSTFQLVVTSGDYNMYNTDLSDELPPGWEYILGTTSIDLSYDAVGPYSGAAYDPAGGTGPNLLWDLLGLGLDDTMPTNTVITLTLQAHTIAGQYAMGININEGEAYATSTANENSPNVAVFRPVDTAIVTIGSATIGDRLWEDDNGDGVQDPGEIGIPNVTVELRDQSGAPVATTISGVDGAYSFTGLGAGTYNVVVDPLGTTLPSGFYITYDEDDGTTNPDGETVVSIAIGNTHLTADFGYQDRTSSIGDFVWNDQNGDGVQDPGEPGISGVRIYLDSNGNGSYDPGEPNDTSDANGDYDITNLASDSYSVRVDSSTIPAGYALTTANDPMTVNLSTSEDYDDADFGYQLQTASIGDRVWNDIDTDGVDDGEPGLAGITVNLTGAGVDGIFGTADDVSYPPQTTNANGNYDFTGLPAGTYRVDVDDATVPPGFSLTTANDPMTVTISAGEDYNEADFGYQGNASIGDYVWDDLNGNGSQDDGATGISGIGIFLDLNGNGSHDAGEPYETTDANGYYGFTGLAAGNYTVRLDGSTIPANYGLTTSNPLSVTVVNGEDYEDADFGLQRTDASIGDFVWNDLDGDGVQDPGESGINGVRVYIDSNGNGVYDPGEPEDSTNMNGIYEITDLTSGTYTVRVDASTVPPGFNATTPTSQSLSLSPGENYTDADFGYQTNSLSISKTSSAGGRVIAGSTITYTFLVRNNTLATQNNIIVSDTLPLGTSYVGSSSFVQGYQSSGSAGGDYLDQFDEREYYNSDGTLVWNSNPSEYWIEQSESDGSRAGAVQVLSDDPENYVLQVGNNPRGNNNVTNGEITRLIDLSGCDSATFSFDYRRVSLESVDHFYAYVYLPSVPGWTQVADINNGNDSSFQSFSIPLNTSATGIRFMSAYQEGSLGAPRNDRVFVDNVQVDCTGSVSFTPVSQPGHAPANIVVPGDSFDLGPGMTMTVTYQALVDDPVPNGLISIDNIVEVASEEQPEPQYATAVDYLQDPTAVTLVSFLSTEQNGEVYLTWETFIEIDLLGYNLIRSTSIFGPGEKINDELIRNPNFDGINGAFYEFFDRGVEAGETYFYWLEVIEISRSYLHEPTSVFVPYRFFIPLVSR